MRTRAAGVIWMAAAVVAWPTTAAGQASAGHPADGWWVDGWYLEWSPLRQLGDLPRPGPAPQPRPSLLLSPDPEVGLFWTGGNPGAVATDVRESHAEFHAMHAGQWGEYHRPLEAGESALRGLGGVGWRPLGDWGAAVGTVAAGRREMDPGPSGLLLQPYSSVPQVFTDSVAPAMEHTFAQLQGALSWSGRGWGLGAAAGYQVAEGGARATRVPRIGQIAEPGVTVGVTRSVGDALNLGVHGRWRGMAETVQVVPTRGATTVHVFHGYGEPTPIDVSTNLYRRRVDRSAVGAGLGASGSLGRTRWAAHGERTRMDERQTSDQRAAVDPRLDRWRSEGWEFGAAVQLEAALGLLTVRGRWASFSGEGERHALEELVFLAEESARRGSVELRSRSRGPWRYAAALTFAHEDRERRDEVALLRTEVETVAAGLALEVAHRFGARLDGSLGYGFQAYAARAGVPPSQDAGPLFGELLWPGVLVEATPAASHSVSTTLRWATGRDADLTLRVAWSRTAPQEGDRHFAELPGGSRNALRISLGSALGGGR